MLGFVELAAVWVFDVLHFRDVDDLLDFAIGLVEHDKSLPQLVAVVISLWELCLLEYLSLLHSFA